MTDDTTDSRRGPSDCLPGARQRKNAPADDATRNPWDNEPTWPGAGFGDDEAVADGTNDDDVDPPWPWTSPAFGPEQPSLWDEAIARIFASKARSDSP